MLGSEVLLRVLVGCEPFLEGGRRVLDRAVIMGQLGSDRAAFGCDHGGPTDNLLRQLRLVMLGVIGLSLSVC